MGKASRLKRLRRLQARRQAALAERVRHSLPDERIRFLPPTTGLPKMSDIIKEFARPWLDGVEDSEKIQTGLSLAVIAWNMALIPEAERFRDLGPKTTAALGEPGMALLESMIAHKLAYYPDHDRAIIDYEIFCQGETLHFNVVSSVPHPEKYLDSAPPQP